MRQALPSRAELPVRETDQWFRILAESTSTAIFVYAAHRVLYVNPACMELTGYSSQELLAMEPGEIAAPEFQEMMRERAAARLRGEPVPKRYEVKILTKDGRERWFDFTSAVIDLEDGEPVALATAVDITDRKQGEERLRAIVEGTSSTIGTDFLRSLVRHLAGALGMEYAFVSEVADEAVSRVRLLALWEVDDYSPPFEYDLRGTPCEEVVGREISYHPSGVWQLFPEDHWLEKTRIESYIAVPLFDREHRPLGHMAVMSTSPVADDLPALSILKIFASRAAVEIERKLTEAALAINAMAFKHTKAPNAAFLITRPSKTWPTWRLSSAARRMSTDCRSASAATICSPSSISSAVFLRPTLRTMSAMIMNGNRPTLISGVPNRAPSLAMIRSQAKANPRAPASTCPLAAQIDGLPSSPSRRKARGKRSVAKCLCTSATSSAKPDRLPPLENTVSWVEVSTTQRTAGSSRARPSASISSFSSSSESALRVSGSSRAIVATPVAATS